MILDSLWPWSRFKALSKERDDALEIAMFFKTDRAHLVKQLRDQDQALWAMSQQPEWDRMKPIFAELMLSVNLRMSDENKRISSMMVDKIKQTYGKGGIAEHSKITHVDERKTIEHAPISGDNTNIIRRF